MGKKNAIFMIVYATCFWGLIVCALRTYAI